MSIYIATNLDEKYFKSKRSNWLQSVQKNKRPDHKCLVMSVGFKFPNSDCEVLEISKEDLHYSRRQTKNRQEFVCLETGEFVNFTSLKDEDVLILCDWDVTMQRQFSDKEIEMLESLHPDKFLLSRDHYPASYLNNKEFNKKHGWEFGFVDIAKVFEDVRDDWIVFNIGVQSAKISAWKMLHEHWKNYSEIMFKNNSNHGTNQILFNYIIQKHDMLTEAGPVFHNAHWFTDTPAVRKKDQLFVGDDLVLFNHHKFAYVPGY